MLARGFSRIPKGFWLGIVVGACLLGSLRGLFAAPPPPVVTVSDILYSPGRYWDKVVSVQGPIDYVTSYSKSIKGRGVPYVKFYLYEPGSRGKKFGYHSVFVDLPANRFKIIPEEGQYYKIDGELGVPETIGEITD